MRRKRMLEVLLLPLRVDPVKKESFCRAERVHNCAFRLCEIDAPEFFQCFASCPRRVSAKGFEVRECCVLCTRLIPRGGFCGPDLRVTSDPLLPKLEAEILVIVWRGLGKESIELSELVPSKFRQLVVTDLMHPVDR